MLVNAINYIHLNPISHKFSQDLSDWKFSSYNAFLSDKASNIKTKEIIDLFDTIENFIYHHNEQKANSYALEMELAY